jgi:hypothetical protein
MGERKVVAKYIPPDFDPSLVPRGKKLSAKDGTVPVRMMLPFSIQCSNCHTFLYKGRKFNSKKEPMGGPDGVYLGITRFRFYIKCTHCARPVTFLTDPKNADYEMESGGTRNFEYTKDKQEQEANAEEEEEEKKKLDPLAALESRVLDSQREMAEIDQLEEIRALNAKHLNLLKPKNGNFGDETQAVLNAVHSSEKDNVDPNKESLELTAEEEELLRSVKFGKQENKLRRLDERDEKLAEEKRKKELERIRQNAAVNQQKKSVINVVARKRKAPSVDSENVEQVKRKDEGLSSLLTGYGSESDSD